MARYRLLEPTYLKPTGHLAPSMHEAGSELEYDGRPGLSMLPLDAAAEAAKLSSIPRFYRETVFQENSMLARLARSLGATDAIKTWSQARAFVLAWKAAHEE
jgi:hypothetical protein